MSESYGVCGDSHVNIQNIVDVCDSLDGFPIAVAVGDRLAGSHELEGAFVKEYHGLVRFRHELREVELLFM